MDNFEKGEGINRVEQLLEKLNEVDKAAAEGLDGPGVVHLTELHDAISAMAASQSRV
jgi:hypothetical protein